MHPVQLALRVMFVATMNSDLASAEMRSISGDTCALGMPHASIISRRVHTWSARQPSLASHCSVRKRQFMMLTRLAGCDSRTLLCQSPAGRAPAMHDNHQCIPPCDSR